MSIIIVGIGDENFDNMNVLDGDQGLTTENGLECSRDLVQFVPFNKFEGNSDALAKYLLKELPDQISKYFVRYADNIGNGWATTRTNEGQIV